MLSKKDIEMIANGTTNANNSSSSITKKDRTGREITKVLQISNDYIANFYQTANSEDRQWIMQRIAQLTIEFGEGKYFTKFRMEFAQKFLPHIVSSKTRTTKKSLLDRLAEIDNMTA